MIADEARGETKGFSRFQAGIKGLTAYVAAGTGVVLGVCVIFVGRVAYAP